MGTRQSGHRPSGQGPAVTRLVSTTKSFFILSIDGGGIRGVFAAHVLKRIEQEYAINWRKHFDMFAGTSTGSIIAAGLAFGWSAYRLTKLYNDAASTVFKPRWHTWTKGVGASRYSSERLYETLKSEFGDATLDQIATPLIIPAVDTVSGSVHVFKSGRHSRLVRDKNVAVADAVMASCSAPTYFDPHVVQEYRIADGGLWANNPSLVAVADARYNKRRPLHAIKVLTLGTGTSRSEYPWHENRWTKLFGCNRLGWGWAAKWQGTRLIDLVFNLQSEAADNTLKLLLDRAQVMRITFETERRLAFDKPSNIHDLISKADRVFTLEADRIRRFLGVESKRTDAEK